jgi:CheY-like chemotaxis protein
MDQLRIALAEDDDALRELLSEWLTAMGHRVAAVADGRALVDACRAAPTDLIVSDVRMPHLDGLTAATMLRRERDIPAVLMSGTWSEAEQDHAAAVGAAVLEKPFRPLDLVAAVTRVSAGRAK